MQKCVNCQFPFTWKQIFKYQINLTPWSAPLICSECSTPHVISQLGRLLNFLLTFFPALMVGYYYLYKTANYFIGSGATLFVLFLGYLIAPFLTFYKRKKEAGTKVFYLDKFRTM